MIAMCRKGFSSASPGVCSELCVQLTAAQIQCGPSAILRVIGQVKGYIYRDQTFCPQSVIIASYYLIIAYNLNLSFLYVPHLIDISRF